MWYRAVRMTLLLSLCFIQMSCGGGAGSSNTSLTPSGLTTSALASAPQRVTSVSPATGSTGVQTSAVIKINFNADMDASSITSETLQVVGPNGAVSGIVSVDDPRTATFTPMAPLLPQANYSTTLAAGIKEASGQTLGSSYSWNFTTGIDTLTRSAKDVVPAKLFGLHIFDAAGATNWPTAKFGTWRIWDANVTWWFLEPNKGEWHFELLDKLMALAEKNGIEVTYSLCHTPTWASARPTEGAWGPGHVAEPANIEDWKNYVRTVATRYKGRIHYYEIWNEPNLAQFYTGSVDKMVELTDTATAVLKEIDPTIKVIAPSPTTDLDGVSWLNQFLAKGGAKNADIIGFHFYVPRTYPEAMLDYINQVKGVMTSNNVAAKPLWNTESGWFVADHLSTVPAVANWKVLNDDESSAYIARSYILNWASGIDRFNWYGWDSSTMALVEADGKTIKPGAVAYNETYGWLNGASLVSCGINSQGTWVAQIVRDGGYKAWIVWNKENAGNFTLPNEWNAAHLRDLAGNKVSLQGKSQLTIGIMPVLIENM